MKLVKIYIEIVLTRRSVAFLVCAFLFSSVILSQDIHFSQFYLTPLQYNVAETGNFSGDYRAGGAYRSQWSAVPVSYSTFNFFGDFVKVKNRDRWGTGLLFNNDVAGDSRYGTTQLYIPFAYHLTLSKDSNLFLGMGLQPGISNVGFRTNQLTFDSQYDGDVFNPSLSTGENFPLQKKTYLDISTGFRLQYDLQQRSSFVFGMSYSHFNKPSVSFFKNAEIRLDPKWNTLLSFSYPIHKKMDLKLDALLSKQGKYKEMVSGARLSFRLSETQRSAINAGFFCKSERCSFSSGRNGI